MGLRLLKKRLGVTNVGGDNQQVRHMLQAEEFMREFDTDSDGKLSLTEFLKAVDTLKDREEQG